TLPPSTCRAIGSMDLRARGLNCPTIELKNWSRGSCRVKHARKAVWNPRSSSIKASISLRVSANWGMANGSSAVRQAGNIFCLVVLLLVYGNRYQENGHVSIFRCRCRDIFHRVEEAGAFGRVGQRAVMLLIAHRRKRAGVARESLCLRGVGVAHQDERHRS